MDGLDHKTECYLARIANEIGYIHRDHTEKPTRLLFSEKDIQIYQCRSIPVDDGDIIDVFQFPAHHADFVTGTDDVDESGDEFYYATDWPIDTGSGYSHLTFIFDSDPTKEAVKKARLINKICRRIEYDSLNQHFTCQVCSQRRHWTDTVKSENNDDPDLRERALMLQNEICNYSVLLGELHSTPETEEDSEEDESPSVSLSLSESSV